MNKEVGLCISGAICFTNVHLPTSGGVEGDQRSGFLQCCCFLHILIRIRNHNYNEKLRRVLVST